MSFRLFVSTAGSVAILGLFLFVPARTLNWPNAWIILGLFAVGSILSVVDLSREGPELLRERMKPPFQRGQPFADKVVLTILVVGFYGMIVLAALDVFRLHLMRTPPPHIEILGLVLFFFGWTIAWSALRENAFAAAVVKYQEERNQVVVDTGPYRLVRHPIYAGGALLIIGLPLWLGSYAATLFAIVPIGALIVRIAIEERLLKRELSGYGAYMVKTRYRVIPFVW